MPTPTADTPAPATTTAPQPTAEQRLDAMELFLQHLVLVAECEPTFTAEALNRWLCAARQRMQATGSVAPGTRAALARLQQRVLG
jgi:hypothetical protein